MRPWMLKRLQRERRNSERERAHRHEQRLALVVPEQRMSREWREPEHELETSQHVAVRRGVWVTDL